MPEINRSEKDEKKSARERFVTDWTDVGSQTGVGYVVQATLSGPRIMPLQGGSADGLLASSTDRTASNETPPSMPVQLMPDPDAPVQLDGDSVNDQVPREVNLDSAKFSVTIPEGQLTSDWNDLSAIAPTTLSVVVTEKFMRLSFAPPLRVDAQWPVSDMAFQSVTWNFASASVSNVSMWSTQKAAFGATGTGKASVKEKVAALVAGTPLATAGYDPFEDDDLMGTVAALQANAAGLASGGGGVEANDILNITVSASFTFKSGLSQSTGNGGIVVPAGGHASASILFTGSAENFLNIHEREIDYITITSDCITVQQDGANIAIIEEVMIYNGGAVHVTRWDAVGSGASMTGAEGLVSLFGVLAGVSDPRKMDAVTREMITEEMNAALSGAIAQAVRDNRNAIPDHDLALMMGI